MVHKNFDLDLSCGEFGEEQLKKIFSSKKIEVKTDYMSYVTGNIVVEYESRGKLSGISTTEAEWWAFYLFKERRVVIIRTDDLKEKIKNNFFRNVSGGDNNTSKMYLIPKGELLK